MADMSRFKWLPADTLTISNGTPTGDIGDTQIWHDGNELQVAEVAGVPGIYATFDFENVETIRYVHTTCYYIGSATHWVSIEIYNYTTTAWDPLASIEAGNAMHSYLLPVLDYTDYINASNQSIVRYYHPTTGNNAHDLYICCLFLLY